MLQAVIVCYCAVRAQLQMCTSRLTPGTGNPFTVLIAAVFTLQDVANMAWSLAELRHYDAKLLDRLLARFTAKFESFTPQGVSNTIWALATLQHRPDSDKVQSALMLAWAHVLDNMVKYSKVQHLTNIAWSHVVYGGSNQTWLQAAVDHLAGVDWTENDGTDVASGSRQLYQVCPFDCGGVGP